MVPGLGVVARRSSCYNWRACRCDGVLATHGATLDDLVEVSVFLIDMADYAGMNEIWNQRFADPLRAPARTTVAVRQLPRPEFAVEIRAVAYRPR